MVKKQKSRSAVIVIPHVDDDFFSCWSVMSDPTYTDLKIVRCTTNERQENRAKIYEILKTPEYKGWVNPNLQVVNLFDPLPKDGELNQVSRKDVTTALDAIFSKDWIDELYFPAYSHHQDHEMVFKCCMSALRMRRSLQVRSMFKYTYMYHNLGDESCIYKPMTMLQVNHQVHILRKMNQLDTILDEKSVNSVDALKNDAIKHGKMINCQAAERFIPIRVVI